MNKASFHLDKYKVIETLAAIPGIVEDYFSNIPAEALDRRRLESAWTLREHLYHIVGVQDMLLGRLNKMKTEDLPVITPYFPDKDAEARNAFSSVSHALARYKEVRAEQIALLSSLSDGEFAKNAEHPEYDRYGIGILANHMVFHEYWHLYRIEELWLAKDEYLTEIK